ncbi:response regulator transcription factor [Streptomyces diastatochromogenes]|uniref:response regulator transcription factor n=1 Tax=Streptomyces diastatochromogenes TaxID=42236 RepID=UPI000B91C885|nr:response regulator transcription factor [Streptomyces diastatochromogenes]MCZ0985366.1 response regulator transcription factor [Streptomyces diastatochromogenes]
MPRLLIVDDHALSSRALSMAMAGLPGLQVVGEATRHDAVHRSARLGPDIVVWHTEDLDRESLGIIRGISARPASGRVLVLCGADLAPLARQALHAGASGFLPDNSRRSVPCPSAVPRSPRA